MELNPKVSIIIPVYNGSNYLREAIDSALAQTYRNIEVIVVNDGSKDGGKTEEIARAYGDRIRYFYKENGGVATAINYGISVAEGAYISWLSHDDVYLPNKLEVQVNFLKTVPHDVILYSDYFFIDKDGTDIRPVKIPHIPREQFLRKLFTLAPVHGCTTLIPKNLFEQVGFFNTQLKTVQDYEMWYRMAKKVEFIHIPEVLLKSRVHEEQGNRTMSGIQFTEFHNMLDWILDDLSPGDIIRTDPLTPAYQWYFQLAIDYKKADYHRASAKACKLAFKYLDKADFASVVNALKLLIKCRLSSRRLTLTYVKDVPAKIFRFLVRRTYK